MITFPKEIYLPVDEYHEPKFENSNATLTAANYQTKFTLASHHNPRCYAVFDIHPNLIGYKSPRCYSTRIAALRFIEDQLHTETWLPEPFVDQVIAEYGYVCTVSTKRQRRPKPGFYNQP